MKIKDDILKRVKDDKDLRIDLMRLFNCSEFTLLKMIRENSPRLTQAECLFKIGDKLNIVYTDLITQ
jgi:hypothetical protein